MLKKEDRQSRSYSKDKLKLVRKGNRSADTFHYFGITLTRDMSAKEWRKLARDATDRNQKLRALVKELDKGLDLKLENAPPSKITSPGRRLSSKSKSTLKNLQKMTIH